MKNVFKGVGTLTGLALLTLFATPARAQATRTWVSGVGDDANPCSRTAPCKTFPGAISKTAAGGEINCLDPGGFGGVTITKSITINCESTLGGILVSGTNAILINAAATDIVTLRGLDIECLGTGIDGIRMTGNGMTLHVQDSVIRNCRGGNGINIAPNQIASTAKVYLVGNEITGNGASVTTAGLVIRPTGGAKAEVSVVKTHFQSNYNGITLDGSQGAGAVSINVRDSVLNGSTNCGIAVASSNATFRATVTNSLVGFNKNVGAAVAGASATLWLGGNTISGNEKGVLNVGASGFLFSLQNNVIVGNVTDGTPVPTAALQ
jgi:hypothetical protein